MTELNPPLYLDQDSAYGADEIGLPWRDVMGEGIVATGDLAVSQHTGSDLKCSIAAGAAWITGDDDANAQPCYRVRNDAAVLLQHAAADATNPRVDLVIAEVLDSTFSGVSKLWRLRIVAGTATSGADLTNLTGAGALPSNAIPLAYVLIPAGSGSVTTANIKDARTNAKVGAGGVQVNAASLDGWNGLGSYGTPTYSSADAPSYVISFPSDVTTVLQAGHRLKLTHSSTVKYFIVTKVGAYSGGATLVTLYGGTDYTLSNSALSAVSFSCVKAPFGFPGDPTKWAELYTDTSAVNVSTSTSYANNGHLLSIPIGVWNVSYSVSGAAVGAGGGTERDVGIYVTLSTANNSESDNAWTTHLYGDTLGGDNLIEGPMSKDSAAAGPIALTAKTIYYLNAKCDGSATSARLLGNHVKSIIRATCAYL